MKAHTVSLIRAFVRQARGALAAIDLWIEAEENASKQSLTDNQENVSKHLQTEQKYITMVTPDGSRLGRAKKEKPR